MSDTPRVDVSAYDSQPGNPMMPNGCWVVSADFARLLERQLTDAIAGMRTAESARDEWLKMLHRVAKEAFDLDDTIGGEPYDDYLIRQTKKLRAKLDSKP